VRCPKLFDLFSSQEVLTTSTIPHYSLQPLLVPKPTPKIINDSKHVSRCGYSYSELSDELPRVVWLSAVYGKNLSKARATKSHHMKIADAAAVAAARQQPR
jgi:hypothetical protein